MWALDDRPLKESSTRASEQVPCLARCASGRRSPLLTGHRTWPRTKGLCAARRPNVVAPFGPPALNLAGWRTRGAKEGEKSTVCRASVGRACESHRYRSTIHQSRPPRVFSRRSTLVVCGILVNPACGSKDLMRRSDPINTTTVRSRYTPIPQKVHEDSRTDVRWYCRYERMQMGFR